MFYYANDGQQYQQAIESTARATVRICDVYEAIEEGNADSHYLRAAVREGLVWYHSLLSVYPDADSWEWEDHGAEWAEELLDQAYAEVAHYGAITRDQLADYVRQAKLHPFTD